MIYLCIQDEMKEKHKQEHQALQVCRVAERIVEAQGKYEKWGPYYRLCEGGLGACPQEILRFTCFEVCSGGF